MAAPYKLILSALVALLVLPVLASAEPGKRLPVNAEEIRLSYAPLVKHAAPAVVNIYTTKTVTQRKANPLFDDPFFRRFFGDRLPQAPGGTVRKKVQNSLGSGVIVDGQGLIVTNNHVIEGAEEIVIGLSDKREFKATIVGTDPRTDLAVLRVDTDGEQLPFLRFADSDALEVGDLVLAIGNPFGVGQTVTSGIVSGLARTEVGVSDINAFIQTDAAINPGNSGGALVDMHGRVTGINTAIFSKSGGSHGIGFAIPSNLVRTMVSGVLKYGRLVRPWLGASGQAVSADMAQAMGMGRPYGVIVTDIFPDGPADTAGLTNGDVIVAVSGHEIANPQDLRFRLATLEIGTNVDMTVLRKGKPVTLGMMLSPPPEEPARDTSTLKGRHPMQGATVANLNPALTEELGRAGNERGVIILKTGSKSAAARYGFKAGDQLLTLNGQAPQSVEDLISALEEASRWSLVINRKGKVLTLEIR